MTGVSRAKIRLVSAVSALVLVWIGALSDPAWSQPDGTPNQPDGTPNQPNQPDGTPNPPDSAPSQPDGAPGDAPDGADDADDRGQSQPQPGLDQARRADRDDPAWQLYHQAYSALASGEAARAQAVLTELYAAYPDHPAGALAEELLELMDNLEQRATSARAAAATGPTDTDAVDREPPGPVRDDPHVAERPSRAARAELAVGQLFHGIGVGLELCALAECGEDRIFGTALLGGLAGAGVALFATRRGITQGTRALINSGTLWGAYNGAMLLPATDPDDDSTVAGQILAGQVLGFTIGLALNRYRPTEGQVALAGTFGLWAGALTTLGMIAADREFETGTTFTTIVIASDLGLVLGGLLAANYRRSRGYTLLIDTGGIVGMLGGLGGAVLLAEDPSNELSAGLAMVGAMVGLAATAYLARNFDAPAAADRKLPRLTLMPVSERGFG
ncbi:MAG: hypothetical protein AAGC55_06995, partial [Myxococcota bacterium]